MRETLRDLGRVPGVVGSIAIGRGGELLASELPAPPDERTLREVAALLAEDAAGIGRLVGPGGCLDLGYAGGRAMVRPFGRGTLLVVGAPGVNAVLLGLSVEQAVRRLERTGSAPAGSPAPPAPPAPAPPADVAAARATLATALVRQIGPIGEVVAGEAWARWTAAAPESGARLTELVAALAREIDDEAARAAFLEEAGAISR